MAAAEDSDIPETGAVFTFGKSKFADNLPNKFWVKNDRVTQIACGDEHTALIVESGRVFMFGLNDWGQLGLGQEVKPGINKPSCIKTLKHEKSKLVACGRSHTIISTEAGHIYSFGSNSEGQLGIADAPDQYAPRHIVTLEPANYKMLTAGSDSSMALTEDGRLFVWGGNEDGKLGLGEDLQNASMPEQLHFDHPVVCVACGYYHTAVVTGDGKLYTMGEADGGKLGLPEDVENTKVPNHVSSIPDPVKWVACGSSHTVALTEFGECYVFGEGENGQLGLGTELLSTSTPTHLQLPFKVAWVFCGQDFTALISEKGQLYTFGDGRYGKLGHGSDQYSNLYKPNHCQRFCHFTVEKVACGGCHMIVTAKVKIRDGKIKSDDEADELKSLSDTLGKTEESPSLSARERRRNELQKSYSSLSQTLPALASFRGLSSLSATLPALKSSLPKINGRSLNQTVVPKLNNIPNGKAPHINSSEESGDEGEEESEEQKPPNQPTNETLPVASPRRKPPHLQEQSHVEDGSDGDDEDDSKSENEPKHKTKKHQEKNIEEQEEQSEVSNVLELPSKLEAELDNGFEMGAADVQKEDTPELQLVDSDDNEKAENTSDEIEELEEETPARESPIQAQAPVATPRRKKSDAQHEEAKQAEEDSGDDDKDLKQKDRDEKKDHKGKVKEKKKKDEKDDDKKEKNEKEKKKKNKKDDKEEEMEDEEEMDDKKIKSKKDKKKKKKEKDKTKKEDEDENDEEEEKDKKKEKVKKKDKNKEKIDEIKKKKSKKDDESEENEDENKKGKNKTEEQNKNKKIEENDKDKKDNEKVTNGAEIVTEKIAAKTSPPKRSRLCTIL
ncbi:hypothetical protein BsWGS_13176 [Bradybaena similaris]